MDDNAELVTDLTPASGATHQDATAAPGPGASGNPEVAEVLRSMEELSSRPVSEHVAVFETAHEALRGALSEVAVPPARPGATPGS